MKAVSLLTLCFALLFCLSACNNQGNIASNPTTVPPVTEALPTEPINDTTEPGIDDVVPVIENLYSVALPITTDSFYTEDNTLLFSYSYQTMFADIPDRDVEDRIIMDFTERIEKTQLESQQVLAEAELAYANNPAFSPFSYEVQYDITHIDQGVLSLFGYIVQVSDSSTMNRHLIAANYNMVTGDLLTLGSILYHIDAKDDLTELVIEQLESMQDLPLYDEFRETVYARFNRDESTDEDFYFSENGLCFYFAPYEIAPRSAGTVIAEIPYNKLTGVIGDEYFPTERTYTRGTLQVSDFGADDENAYDSYVDIIADADSTHLLLSTTSAVQDIRIYKLIWGKDGLSYTQTKNIYGCNFLYRDTAIMLEVQLDDFRPNYMITYSIDGITYAFYLNRDAQTKQVTLNSLTH